MMGDLEKLIGSFQRQQDWKSKMSGMDVSIQYARSFANPLAENDITKVLSGGIHEMMRAVDILPGFHKQFRNQQNAWKGITDSLDHLMAAKAISETLAQKAFHSQLGLQNTLMSLAERYKTPVYNPFAVLNAAVLGLSDRAYRQLEVDRSAEEVEELNQIVAGIGAITAEQAELDRPVTMRDLEKFKEAVLNDLVAKLSRSKTAQAIEVILGLMCVIGFALQLYEMFGKESDITNREVLEQTKLYIDSMIVSKIPDQLSGRGFQWNTRIANRNVHLRRGRSRHSEVLAVIEEGQQVVVITVMKKWLYVSYVDSSTGEPRSGYVYKKYFGRE